MVATLREYYRPATLDEAIALLARRDRRLLPLAGGTTLIGQLETGALRDIDGVVDLQGLGLEAIRREGDLLRIGAMATLSTLINDENAGALANGLLRRAAQGEGPVNFRNAATVGGLAALAAYDSEFYAALLALDASVAIYNGRRTLTVPLAQLGPVEGLVTEVQLPLAERRGGAARVARTPSDRPIVA
ncbi:MAG TPA: FAD binding domain-containing protein, partial [Caldilineaceae bacterium]|nr:FAD binding domain-containing protein [Caldilineaceae bacterium]